MPSRDEKQVERRKAHPHIASAPVEVWEFEAESDEIDEGEQEMEPQETLAARIRRARWEQRLSRTQLADAVGVTRAYISMIETGKRSPTAKRLAMIADALKTTPHMLTAPATLNESLVWLLEEARFPHGAPEMWTPTAVTRRGSPISITDEKAAKQTEWENYWMRLGRAARYMSRDDLERLVLFAEGLADSEPPETGQEST